MSIIKNLAPYVPTIPNAVDFLKKEFGKTLNITQLNQIIPGNQFQTSGKK
jgi:hypothetical protein